jgi:hypothetical protein
MHVVIVGQRFTRGITLDAGTFGLLVDASAGRLLEGHKNAADFQETGCVFFLCKKP